MGLALIALKQIVTMFLIIFLGIFCYKKQIISKENNKCISNIVLNIVNPAVIFMSYQVDFNAEMLKGLAVSMGLAILNFLVTILISNLTIPAKSSPDSNIERIAAIYSNCGFIGIPLIRAVIGNTGIFYLAAYLTMFNVLLWSHGVILMTGKADLKSMGKSLVSPCMIAVFAGVICFLLNIRLPEVAANGVQSVADMNTPLAMMVAGVTIAQTAIAGALKNIRVYWICALKLLIIPILLVLVMVPFAKMGVDRDILMVMIVANACPTGASGTLFAIRFNGNELYASELFGITTFLSVISIPIVLMLAGIWI